MKHPRVLQKKTPRYRCSLLGIETLSISSAFTKADIKPNVESKAEHLIECKPESKTEAATCFVALENNAHFKSRYLSLIHNAYLERKSKIWERIERWLKTGVTFPCHATCILARELHKPGGHKIELRADWLSATFAYKCQRQLSRVVLCKLNFKLPNTFLTNADDSYEAELHWPMLEWKAKVALCKSTPPYMGCCVAVPFRLVLRGLRWSGSSKGHVPQSQLNGLWLALLSCGELKMIPKLESGRPVT